MARTIWVDNRILIEMELSRIEGYFDAYKFLFITIMANSPLSEDLKPRVQPVYAPTNFNAIHIPTS